MTAINTRLTHAVLEAIESHPTNTRLSQALLEVIMPSGLTPAPPIVTTRLSQFALEVITPRGPSYLPNRTLVYDIATERWQTDTRGFTAFYDEGTAGSLMAGLRTAFMQLDAGQVDTDEFGHTVSPLARYRSRFHHCGHPENPKVFADIVVDIDTAGAHMTVIAWIDPGTGDGVAGAGQPILTPVGSVYTHARGVRQQFTFSLGADQLGLTGVRLAVQLEGTVPATWPIIVYGIGVHYYVEPRQAQTFDFGWSDWGSPKVKQVDLLELDISAPGGVELRLFSDLASQANKTYVMPATSSHTKVVVPISKFGVDATNPDYFEGRLLRFAGTTNPNTTGADDSFQLPFQLWSARARYREIGVYVDGTNSEEWLTFTDGLGDFTLAKMARAIEFDYELSGGSDTCKLYTDLPGDAMALRRTITLAASGRRTQRFRLDGATKGKLWRFQHQPAGIFRLYGMRVYAKAMASNENWNWYTVPIPGTSTQQQYIDFPVAP